MSPSPRPQAPSADRFDPARTELLPILALANTVLFPGMCSSVTLTSVAAYGAAREAVRVAAGPRLGVFTFDGRSSPPTLFAIGTIAEARDLRRRSDDTWVIDVRGLFRARRHPLVRTEPFRIAPVEILPEDPETAAEVAPLVCSIAASLRRMRGLHPCAALVADRLRALPPSAVAGAAAPLLESASLRARQDILEAGGLREQLALVLAHLPPTAQPRKPI